ncbi:MAG: polyribonucleotide nucleotidyltransferase [Anaerolineae bacterium]
MSKRTFMTQVGDRELIFETGHLAEQAGGAVTVREGDTMVFGAATMSKAAREGIDFLPLSVDLEERLYATGRIPGSWFRREGRPTTQAILVARMADRPLRPLFPKDLRNEVQVVLMPLSHDSEHQHDILAMNAASAALHISDIPWGGPIGAVRVGLIDGQLVINPTYEQMANSTLDLRIAGTADAINMVECLAYEVPEDVMIEALRYGHQAIQPIIELQERMREELGKPKREYIATPEAAVFSETEQLRLEEQIAQILSTYYDRDERNVELEDLREQLLVDALDEREEEVAQITSRINIAFSEAVRKQVRHRILYEGVRPDGRDYRTIRPLKAEVGIIPRSHGCGLFQRGQTQVLSLLTLGTPGDAQEFDGLEPAEEKRYLHHYNFPPYSTGETWMLRGPKRREIGHGQLAENALIPVLPEKDEFPYTIRIVSEVMSSNGSTSMASVCGSTLALMDGGVPIKKPVAGIAMGLISDGERHAILTDIQGMEDHLGDMDFKVAGTRDGITALQMDIKIKGLSYEVLSEALAQAHEARMQILDVIEATIPAPRPELSPWAPRMIVITIDPEKIRNVIGKGGETIRAIQSDTGSQIHIEEDGTVYIAAVDADGAARARAQIEALTESAEIGRIYTGKVRRVENFGAFVEILPGIDGMVHVSQLDTYRIDSPHDVVKVGDEIMVMVTDIGPDGKIRLSRQAVLEGWTLEEARMNDKSTSGGGGRGGRGGRGGDRGGRGGRSGDRR